MIALTTDAFHFRYRRNLSSLAKHPDTVACVTTVMHARNNIALSPHGVRTLLPWGRIR